MILVQFAFAQEPRFFEHHIGDANEGLPIRTLFQDHQCMLWLGTTKGLARYDGITWFDIPLTHADSSWTVTALYEDRDYRIWIGTSSGKIFYLDPARKVHPFNVEEGHPAKPITAIIQDSRGFIWFATYGEGAYVYTGTRLFNFDAEDGLSGVDVYSMICCVNNEVWLGTDNGISICTFQNETKRIRTIGLKDGLPDQIITSLVADLKGNVWIGTFEYGVVRYDVITNKIVSVFENEQLDEVTSMAIFDDYEVWISTRSSGVWRYSSEYPFARRVDGLKKLNPGKVNDLLNDVEGNIWLCTEEGVLLSGFRPFESLSIDVPEIQTIFADSKNQVWIGTQNGLFRIREYPDRISEALRVLPNLKLNVTSILEDRFHHLWIGTLDKGLYVYEPVKNSIKHIGSIIDRGGFSIMSIASTNHVIWLATLEGVVSFPADKDILVDNHHQFALLSDPWQSNLHFVYQVFVDSKDRAWFATDGNGVFYTDGKAIHQLASKNGIEIKKVNSICEDHRGHLWLNTPDLGLVEYDGEKFIPLGLRDGLSSLNLASVNASGTGNIVITHSKGIDVMEPDRRHFMYYGEEIGISELEPGFNAGSVNSAGHVYTAGRNTIFKYYAPQHELSIHPRTQLTEIRVFDRSVDFTTEHQFTHAQNYFTFHYVGLWYTSPSSVKYLYKLEGYDLQWKESKDNAASYSNLPPGDYTFSVKASENRFFLDEPVATYSFSISKPFWKTYWFISVLTLIGFAGLMWLVKAREKRSERQALHKRDIIESQLSTLKAQINPHFLFNSFNTLITVIDENPMKPEVAIEYVEKLSDFYRSILQYREQDSITLEEEWELVQNYIYLLEKRYGHNLRLHMDPPPKEGYIVPLTLQMLVENAVKHNVISEKYPLDLFITADPDEYVTVSNTLQPKANPEPSTQFGLDSIARRYQLLTERPVIIEKREHDFRVRIPFIKKVL
jgi:ligand-binding sensor domain-containing protein